MNKTRQDRITQDKTRQDKIRQPSDKTRQDKTRHDNHKTTCTVGSPVPKGAKEEDPVKSMHPHLFYRFKTEIKKYQDRTKAKARAN